MQRNIWQKLKAEFAIWRIGALPGMAVIGLVILVRLTGGLQFFELITLDNFLRLRPAEAIDERILIIGINEKDIRRLKTYPIPDAELADLIEKIESDRPAVIGIDIVRDLPVEPGHSQLVKVFQNYQNVIGIEKVLHDRHNFLINPPPALPPERVGFIDAILDNDGNLRRSLLSTSNKAEEFKLSFSILLAEQFLSIHGYSLENTPDDEWEMQFGSTELTRFRTNSGGYVRADDRGNQILLNVRNGQKPFRIVSLEDIKTGKVDPSWIRQRIVLIGITSLSAKDIINVPSINSINPGLVYGVEIQAHAVSQIISAVLYRRPLLKVWPDKWEYLWILAWGVLGISLARIFYVPWKIILILATAGIGLGFVCFIVFIIDGLWIPLVPALLVLLINSVGLTASLFYRYQQNLKLLIYERQLVIDEIFNAIHNVPLQTLKQILRNAQDQDLSNAEWLARIKDLDLKIREVYESVRRETIIDGNSIYIGDVAVDLQAPTQEIFYQVYSNTIARDLPCFATIKYTIIKFEELSSQGLTIEQKRSLCRFLEESLCNVGKYAKGVTRLKVICAIEEGQNIFRIEDNGIGDDSIYNKIDRSEGIGTKQTQNLARQLGGKFKRYPNSPQGTICELTWPVTKNWFWYF